MKLFALVVCLLVIGANAHWLPNNGRVVGGTNAKTGEIPYIVSLRSSNSHICGGSILDATHILTAAHCTSGMAGTLSIQYGVTEISQTGPQIIEVKNIIVHPSFSWRNLFNDVSVLELEKPIVFSDLAKPIQLPEQDGIPPAGEWAVLAGWGYERTGGSVQKYLQRVDLLVYSDEDCNNAHGSKVSSLHNVCGGIPEGGKGQCSGDSGGPLVYGDVQYGVVSWSVKPCTVKGYPGVYARVTNYVNWINAQRGL